MCDKKKKKEVEEKCVRENRVSNASLSHSKDEKCFGVRRRDL